jgi:hypothetical protein
MKLLSPEGILIEVSDEKADKLLASGFTSYTYQPETKMNQPRRARNPSVPASE